MEIASTISQLREMNAEQLLQRSTAVLPPWITGLLVLALSWQLAQLTWALFPQGSDQPIALPAAAAPPPDRPVTPSLDTARIITAHIFGVKPAQPVIPSGPDPDEIEEANINMTLRGTIAANDPAMALAIVADDRGEEQVYAVGDVVAPGRELYQVFPDRVILQRGTEYEALSLPREGDSDTPTRRTRRTAGRAAATTRANPSSAATLRQTIAQNPARLTDLIRPQPVFKDGKQLGYRVYPGRKRKQFVSLGLKPGDLVTQINGMSLDDPARGMDVFRSLAETTQVTVTVERNGSPQVLVLDTNSINLESDGVR